MLTTFTCLVIAISVIQIDSLVLRNEFQSYNVKDHQTSQIKKDLKVFGHRGLSRNDLLLEKEVKQIKIDDARTKNLNAKKPIPSEERYSMPSRSSQHGLSNNFNRPFNSRAYSSPYDYRSRYEYEPKPNDHFIHEQMRYEARRYDQRNPNQPMMPFHKAIHLPPMPYMPSRQYPPSMPFYPHMMHQSFMGHNLDLSNEMRRQAEYNRETMLQPNENNKTSEKMFQLDLNRDIDAHKNVMEQFLGNFDQKPDKNTNDIETSNTIPDLQTAKVEEPIAQKTPTINNVQETALTEKTNPINTGEIDVNKTANVNDNIEDKNV